MFTNIITSNYFWNILNKHKYTDYTICLLRVNTSNILLCSNLNFMLFSVIKHMLLQIVYIYIYTLL